MHIILHDSSTLTLISMTYYQASDGVRKHAMEKK